MDRSKFFAGARADVFGRRVSQKQVDGTEAILAEAERRGVPLKHLAYILATAYHETAATMQPIREYGRGKGRAYGKPVGPFSQVYYGRGFVQLTWLDNYDKAGRAFGVDLVKEPDRALEPVLAANIMFTGMAEGWFTTKKLAHYINDQKTDYVGARRIVNGTDRAQKIAGYARSFEAALTTAGYVPGAAPASPTQPVSPLPASPPRADPGNAPTPAPLPRQPDDPGVDPSATPSAGKKGLPALIIAAIVAVFSGLVAWFSKGK